jgi:hypothetical protein
MDKDLFRKAVISMAVVFGLALIYIFAPTVTPYRGMKYQTVSCDMVDLTGDDTFDILVCDGGITVPLAETPTELVRSE